MNIRRYVYIILTLCAFNFLCFTKCLAGEDLNRNLIETLNKAEHSKWREKNIVIRKVQEDREKLLESEKAKLVEMFEKESKFQDEYVDNLRRKGFSINDAIDKFDQEVGRQEYRKYFGTFADLISSFKDIRAVPSLLRGLFHYDGVVVFTYVISMGEIAVKPLMNLTNSEDRVLRIEAFAVLSKWINAPISGEDYEITEEMAIKNPIYRERIKTLFLEVLRDEDIDVRSSAVFGLRAFPDDTVLRELEKVAASDSYSYYSTYEKKMIYPIREDALRSVEKIKEKIRTNKKDGQL